MLSAFVSIAAISVVIFTRWLYKWWNPNCNEVLPPGSMGWPLLGETLYFFAPNTSSDVSPFVKKRMQIYGPIFKTSLAGQPVIVSTDADLNYFIFQQEGQLFESWYPSTFMEVFGRENLGSLNGFMYMYLKNMVLNLFGPKSQKKMLPEVEHASNIYLKRWSSQKTTEIKESTSNMIFYLTAKKIISYDAETSSDDLRGNFHAFIKRLLFPSKTFLEQPTTSVYSVFVLRSGKKKGNEDAQKHAKKKDMKGQERPKVISLITF